MKEFLEALALAVPFFVWTLWLLRRKASKTWGEGGAGTTDSVETHRERAHAYGSEHPSAPQEELPPNGLAASE